MRGIVSAFIQGFKTGWRREFRLPTLYELAGDVFDALFVIAMWEFLHGRFP